MQKRTRSYVTEAVRLILEKPNIQDLIVLNKYGNPVETTMELDGALVMAGLCKELRGKVEAALNVVEENSEMVMIRIRSRKNETIITPDKSITIITVQKLNDNFQK